MTSTSPDPDPAPSPQPVAVGRPRTATWPGRRAARPPGTYDPDPLVRDAPAGTEVSFVGEDGRSRVFSFATLPLPGWHADLAAAFARLTGPTGSVRTLAGAKGAWGALGRLLRFLASLPRPPRDPSRLTARQLRRFELHRRQTCKPNSVVIELGTLRGLLGQITPQESLRAEVVDWLGQRRGVEAQPGTPGYSEQEFGRIMAPHAAMSPRSATGSAPPSGCWRRPAPTRRRPPRPTAPPWRGCARSPGPGGSP